MKRKIRFFCIGSLILILLTGCSHKNIERNKLASTDTQVLECLRSELGAYLVTENDDLTEIPLFEITNQKDKIDFYYGVMANEDNKMILLKTNITYEWEVMRDFELYFVEKYPIYQKYYFENVGIYIFVHNRFQDVDFSELKKKCSKNNFSNEEGKNIPNFTIEKLNETNKIVILSGDTELGTIKKKEKIEKILDTVESSKQYGENFLCDGNGFIFEMYNANNELIDTIYVWGDGKRLIPKSIHEGCSYYIATNEVDLRRIIEDETDSIFYGLLDYRENMDNDLILIYEDNQYNYYLKGSKGDDVFIYFDLNQLTMTLQYALKQHYITPEQLEIYDDLLIKKAKK